MLLADVMDSLLTPESRCMLRDEARRRLVPVFAAQGQVLTDEQWDVLLDISTGLPATPEIAARIWQGIERGARDDDHPRFAAACRQYLKQKTAAE